MPHPLPNRQNPFAFFPHNGKSRGTGEFLAVAKIDGVESRLSAKIDASDAKHSREMMLLRWMTATSMTLLFGLQMLVLRLMIVIGK
jgi:hypothetical protein